jgi:hypothetical protein
MMRRVFHALNKPFWAAAFLLALLHLFLHRAGVLANFNFSTWYWQHPAFVIQHFPQSLIYWHATPPFMGGINAFFYFLYPEGFPNTLYVFLFVLHLFAFHGVYKAAIPFIKPLWAFLFAFWAIGNPAVLIGVFNYSPTTMVMLSAFILLPLFHKNEKAIFNGFGLWWIAMSFIRASFSIWVALVIALLMWPQLKRNLGSMKILLGGVLMLIIPLKNYWLFDVFSSNSWQTRNFAAHIPPNTPMLFNFENRFENVSFFDSIDPQRTNTPLSRKWANEPVLNQPDKNHIGMLAIEKAYKNAILQTLNPITSLKHSILGTFTFFSDPFSDNVYTQMAIETQWSQHFYWRMLDLPNYVSPKGTQWRFSGYIFLFLPLFLLVLYFIPQFPPALKMLAIHLILFTAMYCIIDPNESNRMRLELEPFYYFFALYLFHGIRKNQLHFKPIALKS